MGEYDTKRRFPRLPSANSVMVTKLAADGVEGFTKTKVVSPGGCLIMSDVPFGVGSLLEIRIAVHGRVATAVGRVVHETEKSAGEIEVGVEFVEIGEPDRDIIRGLFPL